MMGPDGTPDGIRVVLADDHGLFRTGVSEMLSVAGDIEVVAEAADHEEAVAAVAEHAPDVVLLDLEMPGAVGLYRASSDDPKPPQRGLLVLPASAKRATGMRSVGRG
jgi:DNA-binding NarL/FixJ family response regulator